MRPFGKPAADKDKARQARADAILDAALTVFMQSGFDVARMDDVAKLAGLSKAGVYLYFPSKEAVLKALILREVKGPIVSKVALLDGVPAADALRFISTLAHERMSDPRVAAVPRLVISIGGRYPDIVEFYRREVIETAMAAVLGVLRRGMASGEFRAVVPESVVPALIGPVLFAGLLRHVFGGVGPEPPEAAKAHIDLLIEGLGVKR